MSLNMYCLFFSFYNLYILIVFIFYFNIYFIVIAGNYLYVQEIWGDWDWDIDDFSWKIIYLTWETNVSGVADVFYDDYFFPFDNYLYPENRFFFIYNNTVIKFWI